MLQNEAKIKVRTPKLVSQYVPTLLEAFRRSMIIILSSLLEERHHHGKTKYYYVCFKYLTVYQQIFDCISTNISQIYQKRANEIY